MLLKCDFAFGEDFAWGSGRDWVTRGHSFSKSAKFTEISQGKKY